LFVCVFFLGGGEPMLLLLRLYTCVNVYVYN